MHASYGKQRQYMYVAETSDSTTRTLRQTSRFHRHLSSAGPTACVTRLLSARSETKQQTIITSLAMISVASLHTIKQFQYCEHSGHDESDIHVPLISLTLSSRVWPSLLVARQLSAKQAFLLAPASLQHNILANNDTCRHTTACRYMYIQNNQTTHHTSPKCLNFSTGILRCNWLFNFFLNLRRNMIVIKYRHVFMNMYCRAPYMYIPYMIVHVQEIS